jgi:hypothetical protein
MNNKIWNLKYVAGNPALNSRITACADNPMTRATALEAAEKVAANGWRAWVEHEHTFERIFESPAETNHQAEAQDQIVWPSSRDTARLEDMSPNGHLRVTLDESGDAIVEVFDGEHFASVEFCSGSGGGGKSPRVRRALIALMVAMEADNKADVTGGRRHPRYGELYT